MVGLVRSVVIIGAIAFFSPVHDESPRQRLDGISSAPGRAATDLIREAPSLAADLTARLEPAQREALSRAVVQYAQHGLSAQRPATAR